MVAFFAVIFAMVSGAAFLPQIALADEMTGATVVTDSGLAPVAASQDGGAGTATAPAAQDSYGSAQDSYGYGNTEPQQGYAMPPQQDVNSGGFLAPAPAAASEPGISPATIVLIAVVGTSLLCCCIACFCCREIWECLCGAANGDPMPFEGGAGDGYGPVVPAMAAAAGGALEHYEGWGMK